MGNLLQDRRPRLLPKRYVALCQHIIGKVGSEMIVEYQREKQ